MKIENFFGLSFPFFQAVKIGGKDFSITGMNLSARKTYPKTVKQDNSDDMIYFWYESGTSRPAPTVVCIWHIKWTK